VRDVDSMPAEPFSDFVVYVDESGDHGLETMEATYPIFVLAFCIFRKADYVSSVVPALQGLKFKYFGHDLVVLHEREIRKAKGPFSVLQRPEVRQPFMEDLTKVVNEARFMLIAAVIKKLALKQQYARPENPYHLAMEFCLERLYYETNSGPQKGRIHVIFESRGKAEDAALELEFRRVCSRGYPFEPVFAPKGSNSTGLQLADLVARPIGRKVLAPDQSNRAYEALEPKFRRSAVGKIHGFGLKLFP
jgi:hypothetical protein